MLSGAIERRARYERLALIARIFDEPRGAAFALRGASRRRTSPMRRVAGATTLGNARPVLALEIAARAGATRRGAARRTVAMFARAAEELARVRNRAGARGRVETFVAIAAMCTAGRAARAMERGACRADGCRACAARSLRVDFARRGRRREHEARLTRTGHANRSARRCDATLMRDAPRFVTRRPRALRAGAGRPSVTAVRRAPIDRSFVPAGTRR